MDEGAGLETHTTAGLHPSDEDLRGTHSVGRGAPV